MFGFSISFAPFSREQAFAITVAAFATALRGRPGISKDGEWMQTLFREAFAECMRTAPMGSPNTRQEPLKTVHEALFKLSAADKAVVLFRDQCHFSFETIGAILGTGAQQSRLSCLAARERLRTALKTILEKSSGDRHGL